MKIKNFLFTLALSLVTIVGFAQQKDTLLSNNICLYNDAEHVDDVVLDTRIIFSDSLVTFFNLEDSSTFTVKLVEKLSVVKITATNETATRWKAKLKDTEIVFGILTNADNKTTSLAVVKEGYALVFLIVPKREAVLNKN